VYMLRRPFNLQPWPVEWVHTLLSGKSKRESIEHVY
jgi:hypothetical protein